MSSRRLIPALATLSLLCGASPALADTTTGGVDPAAHPPARSPDASAPARPTVPGMRARLVNGIAYAPDAAPASVKRLIWAVNGIVGRPYVLGGGHKSFRPDRGYDCSGLVSYAIHAAGVLAAPMSAPGFRRFGTAGPGWWITVWAHGGHVFAQVAGLRLDTTPYPSRGVEGAGWRDRMRDVGGYTARHPARL